MKNRSRKQSDRQMLANETLQLLLDNLVDQTVMVGPVMRCPETYGWRAAAAWKCKDVGFQRLVLRGGVEARTRLVTMLAEIGLRVIEHDDELSMARDCERRWPCAETRRLVGEVEREVVERERVQAEKYRLQQAADLVLSVYREDRPIAVAKRPGAMVMGSSLSTS